MGTEKRQTLDAAVSWCGLIGSVISILLLVFEGGKALEKQNTLIEDQRKSSARIDSLEGAGGQSLIAHSKLNEEQQKAIDARLKRLEDIVGDIPKITTILARIETDMDYLTGRKRVPQLNRDDSGQPQNYQPSAYSLPPR